MRRGAAGVALALLLLLGTGTHARGQEPRLHVVAAPGETLTVSGTAGTAPTVVLIPGLLGSAYGWRKLVPQLVAAGFSPIVIEPLGVGTSSRPPGADYSLTAQADRIARVLSMQQVGSTIVIAHGVAGSMALRLALRHPEKVRGIVSIDGGPAETAASPGLARAMKFAGLFKFVAGSGAIRGKLRGELEDASGDPSWITEEVLHGYTDPLLADFGATAAAFRAMAASHEAEPLIPNLGRIRVPVELLTGGAPHEYALPLSEMKALQEGLPDFQGVSVPGAGHYIQEEQPEAVVMAVRRVVRRGS